MSASQLTVEIRKSTMPFVDKFVTFMNERGIPIDATVVPEPEVIETALNNVQFWWDELNSDVREGFDEGSEEFAVCFVLAEPEINVAPELSGILQSFDKVADRRLSELLQTTREVLLAASENI